METSRIFLKYELFCNLLLEEKLFLYPALTFSSLCQMIHVEEKSLEEYLLLEQGVRGQELIDNLRDNFNSYLMRKYGRESFL